MCKVIVIGNQKGGVGKTTTTSNLGIGLAKKGKKVLLIDADAQGSLTASLGFQEPDKLDVSLATIMANIINEEDMEPDYGILKHDEGVDLMPGNIELSGLEVSLVNVMSRELVLRTYIEQQKERYDYILIDCMPSLGMITINAFASADSILIPVQAAYLPVKGLEQLIKTIGKVKRQINPKLEIEGILLTMVDNRTNYAKDISALVVENYGSKVRIFENSIPMSVRAAEISAEGVSIYEHDPNGKVASAYTQHRINESAVLTLVSDTLRAIAEYSKNDRTEFIHTVQETQVAQQSADIAKKRRRLAAAQKRAGELEKLICKIYEDNALGKLPDARYRALDAQYAKEQDALEIEIAELEKAVTGYEQSQKSAEKFIALIDKYENFDTLTNTMLNEFVEKILVHERARKGSQDTTQEIEIYFNFLGRYIPPSLQPVPLTPEEQEELRKKEERKDRLHQNYLKRKASGAQKRYEDKIKAKKKAEMDAKKAMIRAEDMKKGVFSTIGQLPKEEPRKGSIAASAAV